ncbi:YoaK family protein [Saxibacter everestensis]|uniref:YoaK family protein n=1 Tax=Saxibacter everestensis TaxID=2909229 RepID=A0ABY8QU26_9MICO|nr:YoaK family protein [Brevibacteriaceae bacterium ZFBP1038]
MKRSARTSTERVHLSLMLVLTFSTGVVDAVGYLGLDRVFTGNMTGNVVLLGMAIAGADDLPVVRPALALVFFMLGAALAGRLLRGRPSAWGGRTSLTLFAVTAILAGLAVFVGVVDVQGDDVLAGITTSLLAVAMGIQAATARALKVADVTTVVVTSTITALAADSRFAGGKSAHWPRRLLAIGLILLGAGAGALALRFDLWLGIAVSAALTLLVAMWGHLRYRRDRRAQPVDAPDAQWL